jgi:hypothetical protein
MILSVRFGSVLKILPSVRFNFSKTQTDPITAVCGLFNPLPMLGPKGQYAEYKFSNNEKQFK